MDDLLTRVRAILATTPMRWQSLTGAVPAALLTRPPLLGQWTALGCLQHLLDTERLAFPARMRALLAGEDFPAFDPDAEGSQNAEGAPDELTAQFVALRAESLAALSAVASDDLSRTARHAELGMVTLGELLHEWAAHDLNHTIQAEQALMQPFIAGCGPWRSYFKNHDVAESGA